jgi:hypothetical protein
MERNRLGFQGKMKKKQLYIVAYLLKASTVKDSGQLSLENGPARQ